MNPDPDNENHPLDDSPEPMEMSDEMAEQLELFMRRGLSANRAAQAVLYRVNQPVNPPPPPAP